MATRNQSNPNKKSGAMSGFQGGLDFAGDGDRKPAQLPKLDNTRALPGLWSWQDRQAYVDSKPGTMMYELYSTATQQKFKRILDEINAQEAAKKAARDADHNSRRRY